jgi:hypothetical protein
MALNRCLYVSLLIPVSMLLVTPASAADDAYLKMLEGEAADVHLDKRGQLETADKDSSDVRKNSSENTVIEWNGKIQGENLPNGLAQGEFEKFLQNNFYGTYVFFKKLNSIDKNTVYYRYSIEEKPNLQNVRQNVLTLLKQ